MTATIHDDRVCALGEGPLWHPERGQLYWFDILGKRLLTVEAGEKRHWQFDEFVSAAGWVDRETLLLASQTGLYRFDLTSGDRGLVAELEAGNPHTRSNDGRADPFGGYWIGTMGQSAEPGAGAIYRYYRGKLACLFDGITISNAICFSPDGDYAYFTDTASRRIMRQALDRQGWPEADPEVFVDLQAEGLNPDGAVVDGEGCLWVAQWGAARVARYGPDGRFLSKVAFPARQISCPAFGGDGLSTLYATSATQGLAEPGPQDGMTFRAATGVKGQKEHRIIL